VLQCVAVHCSVSTNRLVQTVSKSMCVLQRVAACCMVLQGVAGCCRVLQSVAVCCSVLQCVFLPLPPLFHSLNLQVQPVSPHPLLSPPLTRSLSRVTHMDESCHTHIIRAKCINESRNASEYVMSHISMSPVTHTNESYHTHE